MGRVKAVEGNLELLKLVKNNLDDIIPSSSRKIGLSVSGVKVDLADFLAPLPCDRDRPLVFVIGAVAKSDPAPQCPVVQENICISDHSLSAAVCCSKLCTE